MMRPLSSQDHDSALATGLNVLVFRMAESQACRQFQPELDEFVRSRPGTAVWTVEAMEQRDLADRHGLRALPSIVIYRDGLPARRFAGGISAEELGREVDEVAAADMAQELNDWMVWMMETGEAGSPFIDGSPDRPGAGESDDDSSAIGPAGSSAPTVLGRPQGAHFRSPTMPLEPLSQLRPTVQGAAATGAQPLSRMIPSTPARPMSKMVASTPAVDEDLVAAHTAWYAGEYETAIRHYTAVLEENPDAAEALNGRGQVLADAGNTTRALADLDRYLQIVNHPEASAYARSARAVALAWAGHREEAEREISAALAVTPENAWAHLRPARIHLLHDDPASAVPSLRRALEATQPPLTSSQRSQAEDLLGRI